MKLLESYLKNLSEAPFRTIENNPVDFFNHIVTHRPNLGHMDDSQVELLIDVLEAIQVYQDDYKKDNGKTQAEQKLFISFDNMFKKYFYDPDPSLNNNNLNNNGEEVYEYLVHRYS